MKKTKVVPEHRSKAELYADARANGSDMAEALVDEAEHVGWSEGYYVWADGSSYDYFLNEVLAADQVTGGTAEIFSSPFEPADQLELLDAVLRTQGKKIRFTIVRELRKKKRN